jgi:ATP-binding cassette subfamily B protein
MIHMSPSFTVDPDGRSPSCRITTDTTLPLSVIGSSVSVALRNILLFAGGLGLMLWTRLSCREG